MYGPDASARFSQLLTDIARESIRHAGEMKRFLEEWDAICGALLDEEGERHGEDKAKAQLRLRILIHAQSISGAE
jgi:hypothetical protein